MQAVIEKVLALINSHPIILCLCFLRFLALSLFRGLLAGGMPARYQLVVGETGQLCSSLR